MIGQRIKVLQHTIIHGYLTPTPLCVTAHV